MISNIKNNIAKVLSNKKFLLITFVALIFIIAAIYTYRTYVIPRLNAQYVSNREFVNDDDKTVETADLYFFYTTWCPHCKKSKPEWERLKSKIGENPVNGVKINFVEVDCDEDQATANKFKVEGYPTIKLVKGNQVIEYDAKPQLDTLLQFVNTSL
jgi:thiol-disulfide isomerase/thioredoxin